MAIPPYRNAQCQGEDLDAARRLLQKVYVGKQRNLAMLVFGTVEPPLPICFQDANHHFTKALIARIKNTLTFATTYVIVEEWRLKPQQVDQLQMGDRRIKELRQRLAQEITSISTVRELRAARVQQMNKNPRKI